MKIAWGLALLLLVGLLLWPELPRYRAEWLLADANARLDGLLRGKQTGAPGVADAEFAFNEARVAQLLLPGDPRPVLYASVALLLRQRGAAAIAVLTPAIAAGERPELTLNLGRARGIGGDAAGADAAFLRTAWASPAAVASLPRAIREPLLDRVSKLEAELRAGQLSAAPAL